MEMQGREPRIGAKTRFVERVSKGLEAQYFRRAWKLADPWDESLLLDFGPLQKDFGTESSLFSVFFNEMSTETGGRAWKSQAETWS